MERYLDGLVLLYFTREMVGIIGATRTKMNKKIGMSNVVKSINFIGDNDNNLT